MAGKLPLLEGPKDLKVVLWLAGVKGITFGLELGLAIGCVRNIVRDASKRLAGYDPKCSAG